MVISVERRPRVSRDAGLRTVLLANVYFARQKSKRIKMPGKERKILVHHPGGELHLETNARGNLSTEDFERFFPHAQGLTYKLEEKVHGVRRSKTHEEYILNPQVTEYCVYVTTDQKGVNSKNPMEVRIRSIVESIRGKNSSEPSTSVSTAKKRKLDTRKVVDHTKHTTLLHRERNIQVGWMDKLCEYSDYIQVKGSLGGVKTLVLDSSKEYYTKDIIDLAVKAFEGTRNKDFSKTVLSLGPYAGPIDHFTDTDGNECDLWTYFSAKNRIPSRCKLYLFTKPVTKILGLNTSRNLSSALKKSANNDKIIHNNGKENEPEPAAAAMQMNNEDNVGNVQEELKEFVQESSIDIEGERNDYQEKPGGEQYDDCCEPIQNGLDLCIAAQRANNVNILYYNVKTSEYSDYQSWCLMDKINLYAELNAEGDLSQSFESFNPLEYGYQAAELSVNGEQILSCSLEENGNYLYSFPRVDICSQNPHSIVYDLDVLNGYYHGTFGLGTLPTCLVTCNPIFCWKKNGQLHKKGKNLYWINVEVDNSNDAHDQYTCEISCSISENSSDPVDDNLTSDSTTVRQVPGTLNKDEIQEPSRAISEVNIFPSTGKIMNETSFMPSDSCSSFTATELTSELIEDDSFIIEKKDLIFTSELLGAGTQAKIRKGFLHGTPVAIKTMKFLTKFNSFKKPDSLFKFAKREFDILRTVKHPNIVLTIGVCEEPKAYHIVMEFVDGHLLADILFEDEYREEYVLDTRKKHSIGYQLLQAVNYLHKKRMPIIHRDIKPDNIIISKQFLLKLCDLGISKFLQTTSVLRTTVGGNPKGTQLFMAPEIIVEHQEATVYSDVWAVGCTLVELYTEEPVWNVADCSDLLQKLKCGDEAKPNLDGMPFEIRKELDECFNYNPRGRSLEPLLNKYREIITGV